MTSLPPTPGTPPLPAVESLLGELTLDEKVSLLSGIDWWHTAAVDRLGIGSLKVSDGPAGVRGARMSGGPPSASFPCGTALGATWDVDLVHRVGQALAKELESKGAQVILAPTVNLHRTPLAGRNFECYSEDPLLTARLAVAYISGVQSRGKGATIKHFVANDSEHERMTISSEVPERALRELYLVPFEAAVRDAGVWAVMSAYNKVAGTWCSENSDLLQTILRDEWGFDGLVMSDWFGTHSTDAAAVAGLDLEMPGPPQHRGKALHEAVVDGAVSGHVLDERVRRVLGMVERAGLLRTPDAPRPDVAPERYDDDPARRTLLREAAAAAIVLLRNEPVAGGSAVLPIDASSVTSVAVIGPTASCASTQGGGSATVSSRYEVSPLAGLQAALGAGVRVVHEPGAVIGRGPSRLDPSRLRASMRYFAGGAPDGDPVLTDEPRRSWFSWDTEFNPVPGVGGGREGGVPGVGGREGGVPGVGGREVWSCRLDAEYTAQWTGEHAFSVRTGGRLRLWVGDTVAVDSWDASAGRRTVSGSVVIEAGAPVAIAVEYAPVARDRGFDLRVREPVPADLVDRAATAAAAADVAIVVVGLDATWETEGRDRIDLSLPGDQDELVRRVVAANPRTAVVVNTGAPVDLSWADDVPAIVQLWYPGQEGGNALADVLLGAVNPGGRLPTTFPERLEDLPSMLNYPGERGEVRYGEGLFVGYRAFDRTGVSPRFPFGHGLSYTTFSYDGVRLSSRVAGPGRPVEVSVDVTNTGDRAGDEVVQVYVADLESTVLRPPKELKAFARLRIEPGAMATASFTLDERAFAFWDPAVHDWVVEPGEFDILVGASSADLRGRATLTWS